MAGDDSFNPEKEASAELTALQSIFMDEFSLLPSETNAAGGKRTVLCLTILPSPSHAEPNHVALTL